MKIDNSYAVPVLRIGLALLLFWFGFTNIFSPDTLVGYLPLWARSLIPVAPTTFMVINGVVEIILGALLLVGYFTRVAALIVALHILGIGIGIGYGDIAVRDIALAIASFSLFLEKPDALTLEAKHG